MALPLWPAYSDDTGTGQDGTDTNAAFFDDIHDAISGVVESALNPGVFPAAIIDEVVDARGSIATLDGRLDVSINEDGTLKPTAVQAATTGFRNFGLINLLGNDTFLLWPNGDALAPDYWTLSGAGAAVARTGNGLADTARKHNSFSARLTAGAGADAVLTQTLISAGDYAVTSLRNRYIAIGVRAKTNAVSGCRMIISDGGSSTTSTQHTGSASSGPESDGWEWLFAVHQVSASATSLFVQLVSTINNVSYFSGATAVFADVAPADWVPASMTREKLETFIAGNATTGVKHYWNIERSGIVQNIAVSANTAPTGTALIVDVESWDGAAFTTMLAGGALSIAATTQTVSVSPPGGTYARRCLQVQAGTAYRTGGVVRFEITTDDGGNTAVDVFVCISYDCYNRPLDQIRAL
jgi:hypothetical protein